MTRVQVEQKVLNENQRLAQELRQRFLENKVFCLNSNSPIFNKFIPLFF